MARFEFVGPQGRLMHSQLFTDVLQSLTKAAKVHDSVTVNLSRTDLETRQLVAFGDHVEQAGIRLLALDVCHNRIRADWSQLDRVVTQKLDTNCVETYCRQLHTRPQLFG